MTQDQTQNEYDHNAAGAAQVKRRPTRPAQQTFMPPQVKGPMEEIGAAYDHHAAGAAPQRKPSGYMPG